MAEHATAIRARGKRVVGDVMEIGRLLAECRDHHCKHGEWLPWLEREFGWQERTARNFIAVYEMGKSANFADLDIPVSSLYLLAAPSTPEEARTEVVARVESGEVMPVKEVKRVIEEARSRPGTRGGARRPLSPRPKLAAARPKPSKPELNSLAWSQASKEERERFVSNVGFESLWSHAPTDSAKPVPEHSVLSPQARAELQMLVERVDRNMGRNPDIIELLSVVNRHLLGAARVT